MTLQPDELKALRVGAGLSQAGLGEAIGMARETIGAMERGAAPIELRTALAVRYVIEARADVAPAIIGQGPAATIGSFEELADRLMPFFDRRYQRAAG